MLAFFISLLVLIPVKLERITSFWVWGSILWTVYTLFAVHSHYESQFGKLNGATNSEMMHVALVNIFIILLEVAAACLIVYFIKKYWLKKHITNGEVQLSPDNIPSAPVQQTPPTQQPRTVGAIPDNVREQSQAQALAEKTIPVPPTQQQSTPGFTPPDDSEQAWL